MLGSSSLRSSPLRRSRRSRTLGTSSLLTLALATSLLVAPRAHAQGAPPPRAGTVLYGLTAAPAVWLANDRAWIAASSTGAVPSALCSAERCRPVVRIEACEAPRCPGTGTIAWVSEPVVAIAEWPTDRDGFAAAQAALYAEMELAVLTPLFRAHPAPPPDPRHEPRFSSGADDFWRFELLVLGGIATGLVHISAPMIQIDAALGLRFTPREALEDGLDVVYGTQFGLEARAHLLTGVTGQRQDDLAVMLGIGPGFSFLDRDERFRIPPVLGCLIPELGVVVRTDRVPPAYYFGWALAGAVLFDDHLGAEARASLFVIDDWYSGDDVEVIAGLTLGLLVR